MKKQLLVLGVGAVALAAAAGLGATSSTASGTRSSDNSLSGAGSTFVYPLVSAWAKDYPAKTGVNINYNPVGSGAGIAAIQARTVDFGASDAPLTPDQFASCKGCVQIPWALSATAIAYNLSSVPSHLKMTGKVLAQIYLSQITKWNDPAIKALNPGVNLPSEAITPVFRSDGSGTTYNFTDYLSAVSSTWKSKVGNSTQVSFPTGIGAKGSSGVAGVVSRTEGSLTYVDVAYTLKNHLKFMAMRNNSGRFTLPGLRQIVAAAKTVKKVPPSNEMHIVNPPKSDPKAYPICTFTYVIVPTSTAKAQMLKRFILYAINPTQGQKFGSPLLFAPMPLAVNVAAGKTLKKIHS